MRALRITATALGILLGLAALVALSVGFWLNLASRSRPGPDAPVALAQRQSTAAPRPPKSRPRFQVARIGDRPQIVDDKGRVVVLRGVSVGLPGDPSPHLPLGDSPHDTLESLRGIGVNAVRIPVSWDSLEPTEGGVDGVRVRHLIDILNAARGLDMLVVLAAHQDGVPGDLGLGGLPARSLRGGPINLEAAPLGTAYDALRQLPHRIRWWANFLDADWTWDDRALQDHLIDSWATLGTLLRSHPALVGVSPIHSPECFPGLFGTVFDPAKTPCGEAVADFQSRFFKAFRAYDPDVIAFLEPPVSGIPWLSGPGDIDWTPPAIDNAAIAWVQGQDDRSLRQSAESLVAGATHRAKAAGMPLVIAEAGADRPSQSDRGPLPSPLPLVEALDAAGDSGFFWLSDPDSPPAELVQALNRPCPIRIAGIPQEWAFGEDGFVLRFRQGDAQGPTRVRIPPVAFADGATWDDLDVLVSDGQWNHEARDRDVLSWQTDPATSEHILVVRRKGHTGH